MTEDGVAEPTSLSKPPEHDLLLPDITLANITFIKLLGAGAFGKVFLARHEILRKQVAVKILDRSGIVSDSWFARFKQEAQTLAKLQHPGIVKVHTLSLTKAGQACLVMDYVEGQTLDSLINDSGPLSAESACSIISRVAEALHAAHQMGVIHRDIKPANIIMRSDGSPVVLDFGISKLMEGDQEQKLTGTDQILGTPAYMSPEQASAQPLTPQSDLYALSCVLFFILTGHTVFSSNASLEVMLMHINEPARLDAIAPRSLREFLRRGLAKKPAERQADAFAFATELRSLDLTPEKIMSKRSKAELALIILLTGAAAGLMSFLIIRNWHEQMVLHEKVNPELTSGRKPEKPDDSKLFQKEIDLIWDDSQFTEEIEQDEKVLHNSRFNREQIATANYRISVVCFKKNELAKAKEHANAVLQMTQGPGFNQSDQFAILRFKALRQTNLIDSKLGNWQQYLAHLKEMESVTELGKQLDGAEYRLQAYLSEITYYEYFLKDLQKAREKQEQTISLLLSEQLKSLTPCSFFKDEFDYLLEHGGTSREIARIVQWFKKWIEHTDALDAGVSNCCGYINQRLNEHGHQILAQQLMVDTWHKFKSPTSKLDPKDRLNQLFALVMDLDMANKNNADWSPYKTDFEKILDVSIREKKFCTDDIVAQSCESIAWRWVNQHPADWQIGIQLIDYVHECLKKAGGPTADQSFHLLNCQSRILEFCKLPALKTRLAEECFKQFMLKAKALSSSDSVDRMSICSANLSDLLLSVHQVDDAQAMVDLVWQTVLDASSLGNERKFEVLEARIKVANARKNAVPIQEVNELKKDYFILLRRDNQAGSRDRIPKNEISEAREELRNLIIRYQGAKQASKFDDEFKQAMATGSAKP